MVIFSTSRFYGAKLEDGSWVVRSQWYWDKIPAFFNDATGAEIIHVDGSPNFCVIQRSSGEILAELYYAKAWPNIKFQLPALPPGMKYKQFACGLYHTVVLRDDGEVFISTLNGHDYLPLAPKHCQRFPANVIYEEIGAFRESAVGFRQGGGVDVVGEHAMLFQKLPQLPDQVKHVQIVGGIGFLCALRSDGKIDCATVRNLIFSAPHLPENGCHYIQMAAGCFHASFLRSDGCVFCHSSVGYVCPPLPLCPNGLQYTSICAKGRDMLCLRSDKKVLCSFVDGASPFFLSSFSTYLPSRPFKVCLTVSFEENGTGEVMARCTNTGGELVAEVPLSELANLAALRLCIASQLRVSVGSLQLISSKGIVDDPHTSLATFSRGRLIPEERAEFQAEECGSGPPTTRSCSEGGMTPDTEAAADPQKKCRESAIVPRDSDLNHAGRKRRRLTRKTRPVPP